jgi:uncharacterized protein (TIGR03437 family)
MPISMSEPSYTETAARQKVQPSSRPDQATRARISATYGKLPLSFELNRGQVRDKALFVTRGDGYQLYLTATGATLQTQNAEWGKGNKKSSRAKRPTNSATVRMKLVGADPAATALGRDELPGKSNYFIGNDPTKWRANIPNYAKVEYQRVWPGVNLIYYGNQRQLEYDFVVAPGADPRAIKLSFGGAEKVKVNAKGDLMLRTRGGEVTLRKPLVYQNVEGRKQEIAAAYALEGKQYVSFSVGAYDSNNPLIIDPVLNFSTFLGGGNAETGKGIAVDCLGNVYVTGSTTSTNFPTTPNVFQTTIKGGTATFVTKLKPDGSALIYSTFFGGSSNDVTNSIAVDASGNAYLTGTTFSSDFPLVNPFQSTFKPNTGGDAFVTKLNQSGSALVYSTYLGGGGADLGLSIAVDAAGSAYVTGSTASNDFPTKNPIQPNRGPGPSFFSDAFLTKLTPAGSALVYSTYLGGNSADVGAGVAVDSAGNAYVAGVTFSPDFPTASPLQSTQRGFRNAFVTKVNPVGSAFVYSTFLGGSVDKVGGAASDAASSIAVDSQGNAYVTGITTASDFPTANPLQATNKGNGANAFVTKINPTGSALAYSTYLGGSADTSEGVSIAVDSQANAYVLGREDGPNFPLVNPIPGGGSPGVALAKLNPAGSALVYSTYLGAATSNFPGAVTVDPGGGAYVVGTTSSANFPTQNPLQPNYAGNADAFVAKICDGQCPNPGPCPTTGVAPACKPDPPRPGGSSSAAPRRSPKSSETSRARLNNIYNQLPLSFEANQGQADSQVEFLSHGDGYGLFLAPTGVALELRNDAGVGVKGESKNVASSVTTLRMKFVGANPDPRMTGLDKLTARTNYFIGADSQRWRTNIANYARVKYRDVYPGVDLVYYGDQRSLEYDLIVAPGANPESVKLAFDGAEKLEIDGQGDLVLRLPGGELRQRKPVIYQEIAGVRRTVSGRYARRGKNQIGFQVGRYDRRRPLIIDPTLGYSTFLGGGDSDEGFAIAVDAAGNAYVTGRTFSARGFPAKNAFQSAGQGSFDAFVTKFDASKTGADSLVYSTFLGGGDSDEGFGVAVDAAGNAYVTGRTFSAQGFPTVNAFQPAGNGSFDAFVTKLNAAGNALLYSTFLGGGDSDEGFGVAVDAAGNAYVTGRTLSAQGFPVKNAFQSAGNGGFDVFVSKLDPSKGGADSLVYSTFLGGGDSDEGFGVAVDAAGNAHVTGRTLSAQGFPVKNAFQSAGNGSFDAFVTKLNAAGNGLLYSTFLGGGDSDEGYAIAVDAAGAAYVTGRTLSAQGFPVKNAFQAAGNGGFDVFVTKLDPSKAGPDSLVYSTFLGGGDDEVGCGIAVDTVGNAYVTGRTLSARGFPVKNAVQSEGQGSFDVFVTKFVAAGNALAYSTFLGGGDTDEGFGVVVDANDNAYVTGRTFSAQGFPTKNAFQSAGQGSFDAFMAKLTSGLQIPRSLNFGAVGLGDTKDLSLSIRNIDNHRIVVNSIASGAPQEFSVITPGAPFPIESGTEQLVTLRFTPLAAGTRTATLRINSDDPGRPLFDVLLSGNGVGSQNPKIDVSPVSLDFGATPTGQSKDLTLTARNIGSGVLTINPIASGNPRFAVIGPAMPFTVSAGAQQVITVRFSPNVAGPQSGALTITSNAVDRPSLGVALTGSGSGTPDIAITPGALDFGSVTIGQNATKTLSVNNPGSALLKIYAVTSRDPNFNVALPATPLSLPAGGSAPLTVKFTPTAVGAQTSALLIASNAANKNTLVIQARGDVPGGRTLATDDGSAEAGAVQDGLIIVNRLTPPRYPVTLRSLRIFFAQFQGLPSPVGEQIRLIAFLDPTGSGQPSAKPQLIVNQVATIPAIPANGGFVEFPVTGASGASGSIVKAESSLTIDGGDLYVGFQSPRPARGVVFAGDSNGPQQQRAFFSTNDGGDYAKLGGVQISGGALTPVNIMAQALIGGVGVCNYAIDPGSQVFNAAGGGGAVMVTAPNGCQWTADSKVDWLTFNSSSGGNGNGAVGFTVGAGPTPRQAAVTIAGQPFIVAQAEKVASVSSASYQRFGLAGDAIAAAFGASLASATQNAASVPLPTTIAGTTVKVRDVAGTEVFAPIFFTSPSQVNFLMPPGLIPGAATVTVTGGGTSSVGAVLNDVVAPGIFTANANGQGVPSALVLRVKADGSQIIEQLLRFDTSRNQFVATPIDLGPVSDQLFLILFGTGWRSRSALSAVTCNIGGVNSEVLFAGAQGAFVGLDQMNVRLSRSLAGLGEIDVMVTVDGRVANTVRISIK